jgi:hypothetical protein
MASNSAYLSLPTEEQLKILSRISALELKRVDGVISTPEEMLQAMLQAANESGHRDIFLDCYGKQLLKQNWTKEESTSIADADLIMPKTTPISRMTDATRQSIIESFSTLESDWYLPETRISELVKEIKNSVIKNNWQGLHNFIQETRASVLKLRESNGQA